MNWFNKHVNLTYTLVISGGLVFLILVGFVHNNVLGYWVWLFLLLMGSWWTLWRKGRSYLYLALPTLVAVVGIPVLLCLTSKRETR